VAARRLRHWAHEAIQLSGRPRADEQRQLAESMEGYSRDRVGYHTGLKVKYRRAARYPWLPIAPGPPAPDGVKAPLLIRPSTRTYARPYDGNGDLGIRLATSHR
jgi:hypothetical protein